MSDPDVLNTTVTGTNGTDGVAAVEPSTPGASAPAASWGGAGGTATNAVTGMASTTSSATLRAVGGNGGAPGATANAPGAQATFTSQYRYYQPGEIDATLVTATCGSGGSGGAGAYAGRGGNAAASVSASTFTNPFLTLELQAEAGAALNGANGGSGGSAGYNETDYRYGTYSGSRVVTLSQTGGQGGLGGVGGRGGDGGSAGASLTNVSVSELPNSGGYIFIAATSEGTYGGTGGTGGAGGSGAVAGRSGDGGTGGKGGAGQVTVTGMSITQPGSESVKFSLEAEGNNGGAGGDGGGASTGDTRINDVTGVTGMTTYGVAGAGGAGGNGGGATVTFANNTIAAGSDIIISMRAQAGLGGQGGAGGTAGSSFTTDGVTVMAGTPGSAGANGRNGTGALAFTNNTLTASGTVELSFLINPPAQSASYYVPLNAAPGGNLAFYGNVLNGGGNGTLDLYAYGGSVIINSALESVSVAGSAQNTMTGFTSFASFGAATFVIGGGADTYDAHAYGASSGDHFVIGRGHGNTVINGTGVYNDVQPTFEFRNYGAALSSYAQLLADAHGGRVVTTPDGSTITFDDNVSDLSAARFTFSNATPVTGALTLTAAGDSLSGSSIANTAITITSGAQIIGRTTADSTGKWSFAPSGLAAGVYSITASETDSYGYVVSDVFGNVIVGPQITLTGGADTLSGSGSTSVIVAKAGALSAGDRITGTVTGSSLVLLGGGSFNLGAPTTIAGVPTVVAQEGQGTGLQTITLRSGLNLTLKIAADTSGDAAPGIVVFGAANSDTIDFGAGSDTLTLGAGETVNFGSGQGTVLVSSALLASATTGGGSGNTLVITGGGTATLGGNISGIGTVRLASPTMFIADSRVGLAVAGSAAGGDQITLADGSQSVISGGPNEHVLAGGQATGAQVSGLGKGSVLELSTAPYGISYVTLNAATGGTAAAPLTVQLDSATYLDLSPMQFITARGSSGADTIIAEATNQTLTGRGGGDTLIGYAGGHDLFQDTLGGMRDALIQGFVSTDHIDITNIAYAGAVITATSSGGMTAMHVVSGTTATRFVMQGSFSQAGFSMAADAGGGILIGHS